MRPSSGADFSYGVSGKASYHQADEGGELGIGKTGWDTGLVHQKRLAFARVLQRGLEHDVLAVRLLAQGGAASDALAQALSGRAR